MSEITVERVKFELDLLGNTHLEVATTLRSHRIVGRPGSPCYCPITNYLSIKFPEAALISVTSDFVNVFRRTSKLDERIHVPCPPAVVEFIKFFDNLSSYWILLSGEAVDNITAHCSTLKKING